MAISRGHSQRAGGSERFHPADHKTRDNLCSTLQTHTSFCSTTVSLHTNILLQRSKGIAAVCWYRAHRYSWMMLCGLRSQFYNSRARIRAELSYLLVTRKASAMCFYRWWIQNQPRNRYRNCCTNHLSFISFF